MGSSSSRNHSSCALTLCYGLARFFSEAFSPEFRPSISVTDMHGASWSGNDSEVHWSPATWRILMQSGEKAQARAVAVGPALRMPCGWPGREATGRGTELCWARDPTLRPGPCHARHQPSARPTQLVVDSSIGWSPSQLGGWWSPTKVAGVHTSVRACTTGAAARVPSSVSRAGFSLLSHFAGLATPASSKSEINFHMHLAWSIVTWTWGCGCRVPGTREQAEAFPISLPTTTKRRL
jgi:hypothetical protein